MFEDSMDNEDNIRDLARISDERKENIALTVRVTNLEDEVCNAIFLGFGLTENSFLRAILILVGRAPEVRI